MLPPDVSMQYLLTLPPRMAEAFERLEGRRRPEWFAAYDPPGQPLGSGGGTAHLLREAWSQTGQGKPFLDWLRSSRKLILHAGGQSRRLPAYAATGKLLMPIPVFRWGRGQRLNQSLLDLQLADYERVLAHAPTGTAAMVTSGDVLLRFATNLPPFPKVDVLGLGMWVPAETAKDFGVFFSPRQGPQELAFFLQKPAPSRIRELGEDYLWLVDTGMWLLSERAVTVLMQRCGLNDLDGADRTKPARSYELYAQFGLALGSEPAVHDELVSGLTSAVVPLPDAQFFHFGTNRQMIESVAALQNLVVDETKIGGIGSRIRPDQITQNATFDIALRPEENQGFWVENSVVPESWELGSEHVITGVPDNAWHLRLASGTCLDMAPVDADAWCIRGYGFDDPFRGEMGSQATQWFEAPAIDWFKARNLTLEECGVNPNQDIQSARLFPVVNHGALDGHFLQWLIAARPEPNDSFRKRFLELERLAASEIPGRINLARLYAQRAAFREGCLLPMVRNFRSSVFFRLDLESTAAAFAGLDKEPPQLAFSAADDPMHRVHDQMFRSAVQRHRKQAQWADSEAGAFAILREMILRDAQLSPARPQRNVLDDQIVWGRSPVRLDLAGGWTDTPPYCIEHGGKVLNLAVDLNGQPPIQVFAKLSAEPEIVLRSIDLGVEERVRTFQELDSFSRPDSAFALAKAAFALAGFLPRFNADQSFTSLQEQLQDFGGGIELSVLSAIPKGSGLGTSSILAATVLAVLGEISGLNWSKNDLFSRTLALEQMLTTGGGWQDQAGAIYRGIKLIETHSGLDQKPLLRWLPNHLFSHEFANRSILLYYTGLTRLAKNILAEIVRGIFLNSPSHLKTIGEIGANADFAADAIQKCDYDLLTEAISRSWRLNQQLDSGTNPPAVQQILTPIQDYLAAAKLLGAGGGGFLLMFAKDERAAFKIKDLLTGSPPNPRARFVNMALSDTGLQVTRS